MKHVKHCLFAAITALLLMVAFGGSAFAFTITVKPGNQPTSGHSYNAYQIFKGQYDATNNKISEVEWSDSAFGNRVVQKLLDNKANFSPAVQGKLDSNDAPTVISGTIDAETSKAQAGKVAYMIDTINNNSNDAKLFAQIVKESIQDNSPAAIPLTLNNGVYTASVNTPGYYLIVDSASPGTESDFVSDMILKMAGSDVEVSPKGNVPTVQKKVNTASDAAGNWQDAADYNIGDTVPFQLTGTLPDNYGQYTAYQYVFSDTYSNGLTPDLNSINVYVDVDGNVSSTNDKYKINASPTSAIGTGNTFTVTISDLKADNRITSSSKIIVEYNATLNENAVIGSSTSVSGAGNPNTVQLTYSNNPSGTGTGITPPDTVYVFTYELDVDKVNRDNHNDKGQNAQFILYSKTKGKWAQVTNGNITGWGVDEASATLLDTGNTGTFTVRGLDAGEYTLKEKKQPDNFVMPANPNTDFTISAELASEATSVDTAITNLKINNSTTGADTSTGKVNLTIENARQGALPSTGSMGMFIMIGVGICLMAGAGVYLLKNRNKA